MIKPGNLIKGKRGLSAQPEGKEVADAVSHTGHRSTASSSALPVHHQNI